MSMLSTTSLECLLDIPFCHWQEELGSKSIVTFAAFMLGLIPETDHLGTSQTLVHNAHEVAHHGFTQLKHP